MNAIRWTVLSLIAGVMLWATGTAEAANIVVPNDFATIQAAVTAAAPGDTIRIRPGVYFENVVVPAGMTGLTITQFTGSRFFTICVDPSRVIIDASPGGIAGTGLDIDANNVRINCLTIRHATEGIDADAHDLHLDRIRTLRTSSNSIHVIGDRFKIEHSEFVSGGGQGVRVDGDDGRIVGNTSRNQDQECYRLIVNNTLIEKNVAHLCEDSEGFDIGGDNNIVRQNTIEATDGDGLDVFGNNNQIVRNIVLNIEDKGIEVVGNNNLIERNQVSFTFDGNGIRAEGNDNIIRLNNVLGAPRDCYDIDGNNNRVESNTARGCDGGYEVSGENPVVLYNRVELAGNDDGFNIFCDTACSAGRVEGNFASGVNNDDDGFDIFVDGGLTGFTVAHNTAERNIGDGFRLNMSGATIYHNTAIRNGSEGSESGFEIFGNNNMITENVALENKDDGFGICGDSNTLRKNRAERNLEDGIHIKEAGPCGDDSTGNTLDQNTARNNHAEGIENDGTATVLTSNTASGNRTDCANDGTIATNTGNTCADGSNFAVAGQID